MRGILPRLAFLLAMRALAADASSWGVLGISETGINFSGILQAVLAPGGDIYVVGETGSPLLTKRSATGQQIFAVDMAGVLPFTAAIELGPDGDIFVTGLASAGFVTTPGSYRGASSDPTFLCKLSSVDGKVIFCALVDAGGLVGQAVSVDSLGQVSFPGTACYTSVPATSACIEKINSAGTARLYETMLGSAGIGGFLATATDGDGNLFVLSQGSSAALGGQVVPILTKLDPAGSIQASVIANEFETASMVLDPAGNPQLFIQGTGAAHLRKYSSDLSTVLFDTPVNQFPNLQAMMVDSNGATVLLGGTDSVNFPQLNPTASCGLPASVSGEYQQYVPLYTDGVLVRLDDAGNLVQSTFLPSGAPVANGLVVPGGGTVQPGGGTILLYDGQSGQLALVTFGPVPVVQLGCLGNAASFLAGPVAPEEIISVFGQGLGPAEPVSGDPGTDNLYPTQLAGTQVTFDGVAAPIFYASAGQLNVVTPLGLVGKTTTHVCVVVDGASTNCIDAPVAFAAPAIFSSGGSYAAALNQDGSINSQINPAPAGSIVTVFATGLGTMTPAPADGSVTGLPLPAPDSQILILENIGLDQNTNSYVFNSVNVLYAGPAPDEIEGVSQINLQVPTYSGSLYVWVLGRSPLGASTPTGVEIWATGQTQAYIPLLR